MPRTTQMLTRDDTANVVIPEVVTETALVKPGNQALAVTEGADRKDLRGKENITHDRLILPRIAAAQKTSGEVEEGNAKQIPGLKMFEMFNSLTGERYGNGPVRFAVIRTLPFKAMQFNKDQQVVDFDVKLGDPRLEFTVATEDSRDGKIKAGQRVKPVATEFKEYLILLEDGTVAALSFKSTQMKASAKLESFLNFRPGAAWLGMYKMTSAKKDFPSGPATEFNIMPAGATPPELAELAADIYVNTETKVIDVDNRDTTADASEPFVDANGQGKF